MMTVARKRMRLPPLVTRVTRSRARMRWSNSFGSSMRGRRGPRRSLPPRPGPPGPRCCWVFCIVRGLEFESAGAGAVGQGLDAAVVGVAGAVEDDGGDAGLLGLLGQILAHRVGLGDLGFHA